MTHALIWTTLSTTLVWCLGTTLILGSAEHDEVQTAVLRVEKELDLFQQVSWENQHLIRIVSNLKTLREEPDLLAAYLPSMGQPTEQWQQASGLVAAERLPVSTNCKVLQEENSSPLCICLSIFWNVVTSSLYLLSSKEQVEKMKASRKWVKGYIQMKITVKEEITNLKMRTRRWLGENLTGIGQINS